MNAPVGAVLLGVSLRRISKKIAERRLVAEKRKPNFGTIVRW
jgi:hypothetical protein